MSGVRKTQRTEHRKQMTADKGQKNLCFLSSDFFHLLPLDSTTEKPLDLSLLQLAQILAT